MSTMRRIQTIGEEIANSISHGVGALLAIAGTVVAIVMAAIHGSAITVVSACLYGASMILLYTFSTLYHSFTNDRIKKIFRVFDHCSIFILILGSYIPICLSLIGGVFGWTLFGINAFCTVLGIVLNSINLEKWKKISMALYIVMGWSVLLGIKTVVAATPFSGLVLLASGGICYTFGIIFYVAKPKYRHFVWHLFVMAGTILQYFYMLFYCFM